MSEGENNFAADPPNAVIAFLASGEAVPDDVAVVPSEPRLDGDRLSYSCQPLETAPPPTAGACSLFIDPLGRPLSPVSVAGVHRRTRRRARRRGAQPTTDLG